MDAVKPLLILDIDGTLLHTQICSGVAIPGRTRSSYFANATLKKLQQLSHFYTLVIATARSYQASKQILQTFATANIPITLSLLEDGALIVSHKQAQIRHPYHWQPLAKQLEQKFTHHSTPFEWQIDYTACIVARYVKTRDSQHWFPIWQDHLAQHKPELRCYRDGRKLFVLQTQDDKNLALKTCFPNHYSQAFGVGNGNNDLCWLSQIANPMTLNDAEIQVKQLVASKGCYLSPYPSHQGIIDICNHLLL